jgi:hypothetical protein
MPVSSATSGRFSGQVSGGILPTHGGCQPVRAEVADSCSHGRVVKARVQDHVEDLVEQHQPLHVGVGERRPTLGQVTSSPAVGTRQGLVEHLHNLVHDAGVGPGEGRQQNRVAPLGCHAPQCLGRRAPAKCRQLAEAFGRDGGEVETVCSEPAQVGELDDLRFDRFRRGARRALVEPHQRGDTEVGIGDHQGVELLAARRGELGDQAPVDLTLSDHLRLGDRPQEPVQPGADDPLGSQMIKSLTEQQRTIVVLKGAGDEPVGQLFPLVATAAPPAGPFGGRSHMEPPQAAVDAAGVAGERAGGDTDAPGQAIGDLGRRGGQVMGDEPQEPQAAQLHGEAEAGGGAARGAGPPQVIDVEREVLDQVAVGHLGRPARELLDLGVGKGARRQWGSAPRRGDHVCTSASTAASRSTSEGRL